MKLLHNLLHLSQDFRIPYFQKLNSFTILTLTLKWPFEGHIFTIMIITIHQLSQLITQTYNLRQLSMFDPLGDNSWRIPTTLASIQNNLRQFSIFVDRPTGDRIVCGNVISLDTGKPITG